MHIASTRPWSFASCSLLTSLSCITIWSTSRNCLSAKNPWLWCDLPNGGVQPCRHTQHWVLPIRVGNHPPKRILDGIIATGNPCAWALCEESIRRRKHATARLHVLRCGHTHHKAEESNLLRRHAKHNAYNCTSNWISTFPTWRTWSTTMYEMYEISVSGQIATYSS